MVLTVSFYIHDKLQRYFFYWN